MGSIPSSAPRAADFTLSERYTTKATRSMGRVALMATRASELALIDAGLLDDPLLKSGKLGIAYGSSAGTPKAIGDFGKMIDEKSTEGINATTYIKMMAHTAAVNIGVFLRHHRTDHHHLERLHLGQPGHRLCLRDHPRRPPARDDRRRRRRIVRDRGGGVRYAVRHQRAQRCAPARRRAPSTPSATAW